MQSPRYHDQMSRQQFVAQCAADLKEAQSRHQPGAGAQHLCLLAWCSMHIYDSEDGLARAHRSDRSACWRNLARIAQACARANLEPALTVPYGLMQKAAATHEGAQYHAPIVGAWNGSGLIQNLLKQLTGVGGDKASRASIPAQ